MAWYAHPDAEPLGPDDIAELRAEAPELLVTIDGKTYNVEDCYSCDGCGEKSPDRWEFDEDMLCRECAIEATYERDHIREISSPYLTGRI